MGIIKGVLKKYTVESIVYNFGFTETYYLIYLVGVENGFRIDKDSESGDFFIKNIGTLMNDVIEFTCNKLGYDVYFYKQFIESI